MLDGIFRSSLSPVSKLWSSFSNMNQSHIIIRHEQVKITDRTIQFFVAIRRRNEEIVDAFVDCDAWVTLWRHVCDVIVVFERSGLAAGRRWTALEPTRSRGFLDSIWNKLFKNVKTNFFQFVKRNQYSGDPNTRFVQYSVLWQWPPVLSCPYHWSRVNTLITYIVWQKC